MAFHAVRDRLVFEGHEVLPLDWNATPWRPRALLLGCRDSQLSLTAVVTMPDRRHMLEEAPPGTTLHMRAVTTHVFLNREPARLSGERFQTWATYDVGGDFDHVSIPLGEPQKAMLMSGLVDVRADRVSIMALEQGLFFSLDPDADRSRAFLEDCSAL